MRGQHGVCVCEKDVGSQGMGSDIENRADDLKGVNFVSLAVGVIHEPRATAVGPEVAGAFGHRPPYWLRTSLEHLSRRREELGTVVICSLWRGVE